MYDTNQFWYYSKSLMQTKTILHFTTELGIAKTVAVIVSL